MADMKKVIEDLDIAKYILASSQTLSREMCIRIGEVISSAIVLLKEQDTEIERLKRPDCEHANHDGVGCLGYCGCEQDDEPIDSCKQCERYTGNICQEY